MHKKLLFILTMFAMVIGSASQAQAAVGRASAAQPAARAAHARTPVSIVSHNAAAIRVGAARHHVAQRQRLRTQGNQRSQPDGLTTNAPLGATIQAGHHSAAQPRGHSATAPNGIVPPLSRNARPWGSLLFLQAPAVPCCLTGTVSKAGATLKWPPATGATQITVERATDPAFTTKVTLFVVTSGTAITYIDPAAANGTYYYRVRAENLTSFSAWSSAWGTVLAAPTVVTAASTTSVVAGVQLNWTNVATPTSVPSATLVHIQRATDAAFGQNVTDFTVVPNAAGDLPSTYTDTSVTENTTYYYQVRAENPNPQYSAWAPSSPLSIKPSFSPAAPTGLAGTAAPPPTTGASVTLTWTPSTTTGSLAPTMQVIQRATDSAFTQNVTDITVGPTATSYTDVNLSTKNTYYYRVRAENAVGFSPWSASVTTGLSAPTGLTGTVSAVGLPAAMNLNWTNPTDSTAAAAVVERATDSGFTQGLKDFTVLRSAAGVLPTTYADTGSFAGNTTYYYRVQLTSAFGKSGWSNTINTALSAPTGLTGTVTTTPSVVLTWTNPPGTAATSVHIQRATDSLFTQSVTDFNTTSLVSTYTDNSSSLTAGTTYYYQVQLQDAVSVSTWSNTFITAPATPTLTGTIGAGSVTLNWLNPANSVATVIQRATDPKFTQNLVTLASSSAGSATDNTAAAGTTYYYRVQAQGTLGNSGWSNSVTTALPAPANLTGTVSAGPPPSVTLTWQNPTPSSATQVEIERATKSDFSDAAIVGTVHTPVSTWTDHHVVAGSTYYYQVAALNAVTGSPWSNPFTATVAAPAPAVPTAPSGLAATLSGTSVSLTWTNATTGPAATVVWVQRATDPGFTANVTDISEGPTATGYTDTSVVAGTTYYYRVLAENTVGYSAWSNVESILG